MISDKIIEIKIKEFIEHKKFNSLQEKELRSAINKLIGIDNEILSLIKNKNKICVAHRVDDNICDGIDKKAVHSHTISENELNKIATNIKEKNIITQICVSFESLIKNENQIAATDIATTQASIFSGFCNDKDSCENNFKHIDSFPLTFQQSFLFMYRDLGRRIVCMESSLEILDKYKNDLLFLEPFFKFIKEDFSFNKWIYQLKRQKIETKASFLNLNNSIFKRKIISTKLPNPYFYELRTIETNFDGTFLGTGLRIYNHSYQDLGSYDIYSHYHFWINEKGKQCLSILFPVRIMKWRDLKKEFDGNCEKILLNYLIFCILDPYPNIFFKPLAPIDIKKIISYFYSQKISPNLDDKEIKQLVEKLKKEKLLP